MFELVTPPEMGQSEEKDKHGELILLLVIVGQSLINLLVQLHPILTRSGSDI